MNKGAEKRVAILKTVAEQKKQNALDKTNKAINKLIKEGKRLSFGKIATEAGVSISYLYKYPELKERIQSLRKQQQNSRQKPNAPHNASESSQKVMIHQLRERIKTLEADKDKLCRINESLAGRVYQLQELENLVERIKTENAQLKFDLQKGRSQDSLSFAANSLMTSIAQPSEITKSALSETIQTELKRLGISLNSTLTRRIKASTEETVLAAIEALKEQLEKTEIQNPGGWLAKAISEGWVVSQSRRPLEKSPYPEGFEQWYTQAVTCGFLWDIPIAHLNLDQYGQPNVKVNQPGMFGAPYTEMPWREAFEMLRTDKGELLTAESLTRLFEV